MRLRYLLLFSIARHWLLVLSSQIPAAYSQSEIATRSLFPRGRGGGATRIPKPQKRLNYKQTHILDISRTRKSIRHKIAVGEELTPKEQYQRDIDLRNARKTLLPPSEDNKNLFRSLPADIRYRLEERQKLNPKQLDVWKAWYSDRQNAYDAVRALPNSPERRSKMTSVHRDSKRDAIRNAWATGQGLTSEQEKTLKIWENACSAQWKRRIRNKANEGKDTVESPQHPDLACPTASTRGRRGSEGSQAGLTQGTSQQERNTQAASDEAMAALGLLSIMNSGGLNPPMTVHDETAAAVALINMNAHKTGPGHHI